MGVTHLFSISPSILLSFSIYSSLSNIIYLSCFSISIVLIHVYIYGQQEFGLRCVGLENLLVEKPLIGENVSSPNILINYRFKKWRRLERSITDDNTYLFITSAKEKYEKLKRLYYIFHFRLEHTWMGAFFYSIAVDTYIQCTEKSDHNIYSRI